MLFYLPPLHLFVSSVAKFPPSNARLLSLVFIFSLICYSAFLRALLASSAPRLPHLIFFNLLSKQPFLLSFFFLPLKYHNQSYLYSPASSSSSSNNLFYPSLILFSSFFHHTLSSSCGVLSFPPSFSFSLPCSRPPFIKGAGPGGV